MLAAAVTLPLAAEAVAAVLPRAASAEGGAVPAVVEFRVGAVGRRPDAVYINSERDYRDPRNLSVVLEPMAARQLERGYGPAESWRGKRVTVRGDVRRVRILFAENGKATGFYYFQFHLSVTDPGRFRLDGKFTPGAEAEAAEAPPAPALVPQSP